MFSSPHCGFLDVSYRQQLSQCSQYRIAVIGSARCGKTSTVCHLTGRDVPSDYLETNGMQVLDVKWAVKMVNERDVRFVQLNFVDVGYNSMKTHKYIAETCLNDVDAIVYVCSAVDPRSYSFIDEQCRQHKHTAHTNQCAKVAIMTCNDRWDKREVTDGDMKRLYEQYGVPCYKVSNIDCDSLSFYNDPEVKNILNHVVASLHAPPAVPGVVEAPSSSHE